MKSLPQVLSGLIMAVLTGGLILGSLLVSFAENGYALAISSPDGAVLTAYAGTPLEPGFGLINVLTPGFRPTGTPGIVMPMFTATRSCPPPPGWISYTIGANETLSSVAQELGVSEATLREGSCLNVASLVPSGMEINIPAAQATMAAAAQPAPRQPLSSPWVARPSCIPRYDWVVYYVRPNDNLYGISVRVGLTVYELQVANCKLGTTVVYAGEPLRVPFLPPLPTAYPTIVLLPSATSTLVASPTSSVTPGMLPPSLTPTLIPTHTPVSGAPATATNTTQPVDTDTPVPSDTPVPTETPLPSATPLPAATDTSAAPPPVSNQPTDTPIPPISTDTTGLQKPTSLPLLSPPPTDAPGRPGPELPTETPEQQN